MRPHATTHPTVSDHATLLRRALTLPRVPWLWTSLRLKGRLRCYRVSQGSGPRLFAREDFGANTRLMALHGLWAIIIDKSLATTGMQRGTCVTEVRRCATEAPARRIGRECYQDMQDVRTCGYSVAAARLTTHQLGWQDYEPTGRCRVADHA
jgi:hypothetical protein